MLLPGWLVVLIALAYVGFLFGVASYGDRVRTLAPGRAPHLWVYPLTLAIYCTSWTFFGSVGFASRTGYDFLAVYIGPALMIGLGGTLLARLARLAKSQNITSIADLIAARYGKSQAVAATVAVIAIVGTVPYIALQLKAVCASVGTILAASAPALAAPTMLGDSALFVALLMALFAVLFGTRHIDATEHQHGLMLAIATESIVKLAAFLLVGIFVTFDMFPGPLALLSRALAEPHTAAVLTRTPPLANFCAMMGLSLLAVILLPRQFHVAVVENHNTAEIRRATYLFPLYLVLINLFVVPLAVAGLLAFPGGRGDSDMLVLALPLAAHSPIFTLIAFVGGLSAATAAMIMESVALAIMVSNDLVMPLLLKRGDAGELRDAGARLLAVRRAAIFGILFLAYAYHSVGDAELASIGLLSFAAIAQLAPAFLGGLVWRRGTAPGAMAGMIAGIAVWSYTLLLPSLCAGGTIGAELLRNGPWGLALLRPQALFGVDLPPLVHGVLFSLGVNIACYVGASLLRRPLAIERVQAELFIPPALMQLSPALRLRLASVTVGQLTATIARYLGEQRTQGSFARFAAGRDVALDPQAQADIELLQHGEYLLASAIGAASSRLALSLLIGKHTLSSGRAVKLLDEANAAIHYNRQVLQTALNHVGQGIAVFDQWLTLVCWNRQFAELLDLPHAMIRVGADLADIVAAIGRNAAGAGAADAAAVRERLARYSAPDAPFLERFAERGLVVEVRSNRMPDGGLVTTCTDITPSVRAAEALERANTTLERRVRERTAELTRLNGALARAKAEADHANASKTRFIAAASHDILQPLNAARLYVTSLGERAQAGADDQLVHNIDASLEAVEDIFSALLDISRLDSGVLKPSLSVFRIDALLARLGVEFAPLAHAKGLAFTVMPCALAVRCDRALLGRLLQNLVSNAIKYTPSGRVLVGCRRGKGVLRIEVYDTGIGIPQPQRRAIFREFHRLDQGARVARGVGLGLSIVERIGRVLDCEISLQSHAAGGSRFSVAVPQAAAAERETAGRADTPRALGRLDGVNVLCIDNDHAILDGMQTLLDGWGCRVLKAASLAAAFSAMAAGAGEPDAIVVDYHLDGEDGIAAIVALRRRLGRHVPAVLITADRSLRVLDEARAEDAALLNKPIKPAALRALMSQWQAQRVAAE